MKRTNVFALVAISAILMFPAGAFARHHTKAVAGGPARPTYSPLAISEEIEKEWKRSKHGLIFLQRTEVDDKYNKDPKHPKMVVVLAMVAEIPLVSELQLASSEPGKLTGVLEFDDKNMDEEAGIYRKLLECSLRPTSDSGIEPGKCELPESKVSAGTGFAPDAGSIPDAGSFNSKKASTGANSAQKASPKYEEFKWTSCLKATYPLVRKDMERSDPFDKYKPTYCMVKVIVRSGKNSEAFMDADLATLEDLPGDDTAKRKILADTFHIKEMDTMKAFPNNSVVLENHPLKFEGLVNTYQVIDKGRAVRQDPIPPKPNDSATGNNKDPWGKGLYWFLSFLDGLGLFSIIMVLRKWTLGGKAGKGAVILGAMVGIVTTTILIAGSGFETVRLLVWVFLALSIAVNLLKIILKK
jgi:hypothetical protein